MNESFALPQPFGLTQLACAAPSAAQVQAASEALVWAGPRRGETAPHPLSASSLPLGLTLVAEREGSQWPRLCPMPHPSRGMPQSRSDVPYATPNILLAEREGGGARSWSGGRPRPLGMVSTALPSSCGSRARQHRSSGGLPTRGAGALNRVAGGELPAHWAAPPADSRSGSADPDR